MKFISEIEQETYWLRTYHGYCINSIPILKTRNQTLTLQFFSNILIYLPGAGFLAFSIFYENLYVIMKQIFMYDTPGHA